VSGGRVRFLNICDSLFNGTDSISYCIDRASIGFEQPVIVSISDKNFG